MQIWLDDNRDPTNPDIQAKYPSARYYAWTWVKTVPEAKQYIERGEVDAISFDNDLGLPEEGKHLATWIEDKAYYNKIKPMEWYVHSENSVAKDEIIAAMRNADKFWEQHRTACIDWHGLARCS